MTAFDSKSQTPKHISLEISHSYLLTRRCDHQHGATEDQQGPKLIYKCTQQISKEVFQNDRKRFSGVPKKVENGFRGYPNGRTRFSGARKPFSTSWDTTENRFRPCGYPRKPFSTVWVPPKTVFDLRGYPLKTVFDPVGTPGNRFLQFWNICSIIFECTFI